MEANAIVQAQKQQLEPLHHASTPFSAGLLEIPALL
jgi:hypothetical protein